MGGEESNWLLVTEVTWLKRTHVGRGEFVVEWLADHAHLVPTCDHTAESFLHMQSTGLQEFCLTFLQFKHSEISRMLEKGLLT